MVSAPSPPIKSLDSKVAVFGYLCVCLNALLFDYLLLIIEPENYRALLREDSWVENLTAILFFSASLLLVATTLVERNAFRRCIYALGAIAMVFIAGEEISWGQRIFGFATPDLLLDLNVQHEFNVHNMNVELVELIHQFYWYSLLILCAVTSAAFFCRRAALFGIPLPSILLMFGFLVGVAHGDTMYVAYTGTYVVSLLILFVIYALFSRQVQLLIAAVASLTLVLTLSHTRYEVQEYLFGIACLFYALELWLAQKRSRSARALPADVEEVYQSIVSGKYGEPIVRSTFDVYLVDNQLAYFKEPCSRADTKGRFFLHLIPVDENNLPDHRKRYGFDNPNFNFRLYSPSARFDKRCITRIPLPDYTIDRIRTGQYVPGERQLWKAEFSVSR